MRIVIGSGRNRHVFERPTDRVEHERMIEDVKNFFFRPSMLKGN